MMRLLCLLLPSEYATLHSMNNCSKFQACNASANIFAQVLEMKFGLQPDDCIHDDGQNPVAANESWTQRL